MKRTKFNSFFYMGLGLTGFLTVLILIGYVWTPYDPTATDGASKMLPPSLAHLMGTDNFGRDIFSRVLDGAGTSLMIAVSVVAVGCTIGIVLGSLCGYYGGIADTILTRICDAITAFPSVLLALLVIDMVGYGTRNLVLVLGILFSPSFARVVRTEFSRARDLNYIRSARLMGVKDSRIMLRHILPNTWSVLLPAITIGFNNAILSEASMSFLGLGIQPPQASLGSMLNDSQTYLRNAPWYALCVGLTMVLLILGFSLLTEGLQQAKRKR